MNVPSAGRRLPQWQENLLSFVHACIHFREGPHLAKVTGSDKLRSSCAIEMGFTGGCWRE